MQREELQGKVTEVIKEYPVASVATIGGGKPHVRYMAVMLGEKLSLFTASFAQ